MGRGLASLLLAPPIPLTHPSSFNGSSKERHARYVKMMYLL